MVTLTPSSLKTRSSGRGRKSGTTLGFPRGSSVYLIFPLIYPLAFPPVPGAKDPNDIVAIGKPDRQDPAFDLAETVEPLFTGAVRRILGDDADGIGEGPLRLGERHSVLCLVFLVLAGVPIEPGLRHGPKTSTNPAGQPYVRMASLRGPLRSLSFRLQRAQERDEVVPVFPDDARAEALVVEVDDGTEIRRRAVVEV